MSLFSKKKAPVSILPKPVAAVQPLQPVQPGVKPNLQTVGQPVQPVISHAVVNNRAANTAKSNQLLEAKQKLTKGLVNIRDIIAPSLVEVDFDNIRVNNTFYRTLFVAGYPRYVASNWLHPLLSFDKSLFISIYIYPAESKVILEDLNRSSKEVESPLGSLLIVPKHATLSQEDGFKSTLPMSLDKLDITRNMDTTSLATTFPFTTASLTANEGILYGINEHDGSLVIFNRFSLENSNSVIFGKSGSGKSFMVKLEVMRSLMFGAEVFVIDPEGEYKDLTRALGGDLVDFSFNSPVKINPFDLSGIYEEGENELGLKILSLHGLMRVVMGEMSPGEDALLDRALVLTYKQKGITPDPSTQKREPPLIEDLYKVLLGMEEENARRLAERLEKFVKGSLAGIFNQKSNLNLKNQLTVFDIKELEAELRPVT